MTAEKDMAERKAKRFWATLVVMLLGLQLVIGGTAISLATRDDSVAVVPNYHKAALSWDQEKSSRAKLGKLGWRLDVEIASAPDLQGQRLVELVVNDSSGSPVTGLHFTGEAFHHAHGRDVLSFEMFESHSGVYQSRLPIVIPGVWEMDFLAHIDGEPARMLHVQEIE